MQSHLGPGDGLAVGAEYDAAHVVVRLEPQVVVVPMQHREHLGGARLARLRHEKKRSHVRWLDAKPPLFPRLDHLLREPAATQRVAHEGGQFRVHAPPQNDLCADDRLAVHPRNATADRPRLLLAQQIPAVAYQDNDYERKESDTHDRSTDSTRFSALAFQAFHAFRVRTS